MLTMKKIITGIYFTIISIAAFGQSEELKGNIKAQAEIMGGAFMSGNYDLLLDYTYPKLFEATGGKDGMKVLVEQQMGELKTQGMVVDSVKVGQAGDIYTAGKELHALISQYIYMKFPGGRLNSESTLLAVSMDSGSKWYFLDVKQLTPEMLLEFFPDFNKGLTVPEPKEPVIIYNE